MESINLFRSLRKVGGKTYENDYVARILNEINNQYPYFAQLNNHNLNIKEVRITSQLISNELRKENEEYRSILMIIGEQNQTEKLELLRRIEQNNRNLRSIQDRYEEEMRQLRNQISSTTQELNHTPPQ